MIVKEVDLGSRHFITNRLMNKDYQNADAELVRVILNDVDVTSVEWSREFVSTFPEGYDGVSPPSVVLLVWFVCDGGLGCAFTVLVIEEQVFLDIIQPQEVCWTKEGF
jgi:hypothetical protein